MKPHHDDVRFDWRSSHAFAAHQVHAHHAHYEGDAVESYVAEELRHMQKLGLLPSAWPEAIVLSRKHD